VSLLPENRPTRLADGRVTPPVFIAANIIRAFPASRLPEVEAAWSPVRQQLDAAQQKIGSNLESSHWNWTAKEQRVEHGELSLIAVECEGEVQGLMAIPIQPRPTLLYPGKKLIYIDYLETAPWNQRSPSWPLRFLGAGAAMIAEAIIISIELGFEGRIGLHSLPQAESFYSKKCLMNRIGPDPSYYNLVYFEYDEQTGQSWLTARNSI
jgi:hypothetical protein